MGNGAKRGRVRLPVSPTLVAVAIAGAVLCGGLGAGLTWFALGQLQVSGSVLVAFLALVGTMTGWFVSARLSERAQRRMFLHGILNTARTEIVEVIRAGQDWSGRVSRIGMTCRALQTTRFAGDPRRADPIFENLFWAGYVKDDLHGTIFSTKFGPADLTLILEEYELLFPETRRVRHQLGWFAQREIIEWYPPVVGKLPDPSKREDAIVALEERLGKTNDYSALLEDLIRHVQNKVLSELTGETIPKREPLDPKVPLMVMAADGMLDIVERGSSWAVPEPGDLYRQLSEQGEDSLLGGTGAPSSL